MEHYSIGKNIEAFGRKWGNKLTTKGFLFRFINLTMTVHKVLIILRVSVKVFSILQERSKLSEDISYTIAFQTNNEQGLERNLLFIPESLTSVCLGTTLMMMKHKISLRKKDEL